MLISMNIGAYYEYLKLKVKTFFGTFIKKMYPNIYELI